MPNIGFVRAVQQLNAVIAGADDPAAVRTAAARIDWWLRRTPLDGGESRNPGFRLWYEDVLGVYFRIDEARLRVEVLYAGPSRRQ
ncbi:MAG TPA: hypothetical protein VGE74_27965 [Gemmata sp.]